MEINKNNLSIKQRQKEKPLRKTHKQTHTDKERHRDTQRSRKDGRDEMKKISTFKMERRQYTRKIESK